MQPFSSLFGSKAFPRIKRRLPSLACYNIFNVCLFPFASLATLSHLRFSTQNGSIIASRTHIVTHLILCLHALLSS